MNMGIATVSDGFESEAPTQLSESSLKAHVAEAATTQNPTESVNALSVFDGFTGANYEFVSEGMSGAENVGQFIVAPEIPYEPNVNREAIEQIKAELANSDPSWNGIMDTLRTLEPKQRFATLSKIYG